MRSSWLRVGSAAVLALLANGCGQAPNARAAAPRPPASDPPLASAAPPPPSTEPHLRDLKQLTFGGENAEAYWSFDGQQLIMQAHQGEGCDQIYRMHPGDAPVRVSNGKGSTTCSYFLPGDKEVIYASTHLGGDACPPKPDHSQGYVWALHDTYEIFRANADGSNIRQLTHSPGYDAEATVCKKDGSIVFTSVRDGDIELYRMNADGSDATQVTYLNAASFAPFFYPGSQRIIFSRTTPTHEVASSTCGRSTATAPGSSASRPPPASTAFLSSHPTARRSRSHRTAPHRLANTTPTSSSRAGKLAFSAQGKATGQLVAFCSPACAPAAPRRRAV